MTTTTFAGWGPFAPGLSEADLAARLARLEEATKAQGWDYAALVEAVRLALRFPRGLAGLYTRFDALPEDVQGAIRAAYSRGA